MIRSQVSDIALSMYEYEGGVRSQELKLGIGDKVMVLEKADGDAEGWWRGNLTLLLLNCEDDEAHDRFRLTIALRPASGVGAHRILVESG